MEFKELCELIEAAGYSVRSYSGRGMNGKQCLGIDTESDNVILDIIQELCTFDSNAADQLEKIQSLCDDFRNMKTDSMGRGLIVYFPNIKWGDEAVED